ncbi:uncharacterized protein AB675_11583 [Cyphellophora attinorum]|uniref:Uncharacterized protein n=1 Tax=Cyphellophora attinorum TaxID=1664694 RepID=A0A0N1H4G7_9EURO|nr:uncharacterized protein AB675_11583 [Phialophora attinorum]KPI40155.1 hypothetical protein AB675_11583 [Phialophora attinorum]
MAQLMGGSTPFYPDQVASYYVLFTSILVLGGYLSLLFSPANIRKNYTPGRFQKEFSDLAARSVGAWFLTCSLVRMGCFLNWGNFEGGFVGWYDANLVTLAVPVWHYTLEKLVWG